MSWEPKGRRWWKQYRGKRHQVSCKQLSSLLRRHVPETKEGSYQAANAWWIARKSEVDGQQPPHRYDWYLSEMGRRRAWALRHGELEVAKVIDSEIADVERGSDPWYIKSSWGPDVSDLPPYPPPAPIRDGERPPDEYYQQRILGVELSRALDLQDPIWPDRLANDRSGSVPKDATVGGLAETWLSRRRTKVEAGDLSPRGYDNTVDCLNHLRDWLGAESAATIIDSDRWENYFVHLLGRVKSGTWSKDFAHKVFATGMMFIEWLVMKKVIPPLGNLRSSEYRFGRSVKRVETMTAEEVRTIIDQAKGQLKLHLLLMANCGMTQKDVSDLRHDEVDWEKGRITRKRSKTKTEKRVPTLSYKLWPITLEHLERHRSDDAEVVLLSSNGRRWVHSRLDASGKLVSTDSIATNYDHLRKRMKKAGRSIKTLKVFRKTSATLLSNDPRFARYVQHFLGHSPNSLIERHYVAVSDEEFDKAVEWLGQQYELGIR
jgi:integrase